MTAYITKITITLMLISIPLVSADGFLLDDWNLDFNRDDIGAYALFYYSLPNNILNWINNQPQVIDTVVYSNGYTQVWVTRLTNGYKALKEKIENFHNVRTINEVLTAELPNDYDCGLNLKDRATGEIYNIYVENGQIKLVQDERCLG